MTTEAKICGIKTDPALEAALAGGADYIGLVFFSASPRNVDLATARRLADRARGRTKVVALLVDPDDTMLGQIVDAVAPDLIQLHGDESPERVKLIRDKFGRQVMKAIKVAIPADAVGAFAYDGAADLILFDAKPTGRLADAPPGGNGIAFDWQALEPVRNRLRYMLSGGLTPDNVTDAIRSTGASAVDVSSGVETRPGEKSSDLILRFLRAAKTAKQAD